MKHLYCKPEVQVIKVESECMTPFSEGHEATKADGGKLIGGPIPIKEDTSTKENPVSDENAGAKKLFIDFEE